MLAPVEAILHADIPVLGHLGLTPQSAPCSGATACRRAAARRRDALLEDALASTRRCFALVLEGIPLELGIEEVTRRA